MLRSRDRTQIPCCPYPADECWSRITFQVQGMGITLPQLAKRFLGFLWEQEKWFGWDRSGTVLPGAECPHLGRSCCVVQGALWMNELPHVVLNLSRCGGCQTGSSLVAQLSWVLQEMWFRGAMGGALRGRTVTYGAWLRNPWNEMCFPTVFSLPWLYLKNVYDTDDQCCVSRRYWQTHEPESSCSPGDCVLIFMSRVPKCIFGNPQKSWSPFAMVGGGKEGDWGKRTLFPLTSWTYLSVFFHGGWAGIGGF